MATGSGSAVGGESVIFGWNKLHLWAGPAYSLRRWQSVVEYTHDPTLHSAYQSSGRLGPGNFVAFGRHCGSFRRALQIDLQSVETSKSRRCRRRAHRLQWGAGEMKSLLPAFRCGKLPRAYLASLAPRSRRHFPLCVCTMEFRWPARRDDQMVRLNRPPTDSSSCPPRPTVDGWANRAPPFSAKKHPQSR